MVLTEEVVGQIQQFCPKGVETTASWMRSSSVSPAFSSEASSSPSPSIETDSGIQSPVKESVVKPIANWEDVKFIAISGKRKCGKDFFAELLQTELQQKFGRTAVVIHISEPIKRAYAEKHDLNLTKLMSSSAYKEKYRRHMVRWGEKKRRQDPTIFCRKALQYLAEDYPFKPSVVIVADCRRPSDLAYFSSLSTANPMIHVRISASIETRRSRGWMYNLGIDDAETECALDDSPFDVLVVNESDRTLELSMKSVRRALSDHPVRKFATL